MLRPFISRYRGFLVVPVEMQNIPFHIGFVTQDEVAMRLPESQRGHYRHRL